MEVVIPATRGRNERERMISAMNIVLDILALALLVLAFRLLVGYARHDGFARPHRLNSSALPAALSPARNAEGPGTTVRWAGPFVCALSAGSA